MASSANQADGDFGFQIAPMVDVVFVLLLFFMACNGVQERHVKMDLPGHPAEGAAVTPSIFIDIDGDGAVSINGTAYALADDQALSRLNAWLDARTSSEKSGSAVVIRPSRDASHGRFVQVLALVKKAGMKKVNFA